ncbi:hypothetical protein ACSESE_11355 [Pseudomonas aeruginosa]|uniref:hypothetical protein n=1 Tax=Pseudomonas aeruginosa TaxID=287 RepID=UPI0021E2F338|nr:hypothetical protein [Pseudomonas aeruginosa]MCV0160996.1 hypothetical protein [Pseudomonas aeruginosa]
MKKDNGGQAFPSESMYTSEAGMTLRDYFAAQVVCGLQQVLWSEPRLSKFHSGSEVISHMAAVAYETADAMLKARKAGGAE